MDGQTWPGLSVHQQVTSSPRRNGEPDRFSEQQQQQHQESFAFGKTIATMAANNTNTHNDGNDAMTTAPSSSSSSVICCHSESEYYTALEVAGDRLVVVDCFASWCPPCRQIAPVFESFASQYTDVVFIKVDMESAPGLKGELGVWALPTFVFFRYGKKQGSFMGAYERLLRRGLENNGEVSMCSSVPCIVQ